MSRNGLVTASAAIVLALSAVDRAPAQDAVKIGLILPMTGQQASTAGRLTPRSGSMCSRTAPTSRARRSR